MKLTNKLAVLMAGAILAMSLLTGCGAASSSSSSAASSVPASSAAASTEAASSETASEEAQEIAVTFTVTYADGTSQECTLETEDGTLLSDALASASIISEEEAAAGFVTTVNGVTADWDKDGAWWCLTDGSGEMTPVGVNQIELHDGDSYAFTYTAG